MMNPNMNQTNDIAKTLGTGAHAKKSWLRRLLFWMALITVIVAAGIFYLHRDTTNAVQYETKAVSRGDLVVTVGATGTLEPIKTVEVGIEVSGTIKSVEVDYNDHVEVGQLLAELDTSKLEAQSLQSEAALDSARAKLLQTQATVQEANAQMARLTEARELSGGKIPSKNEFDTQKAELARAHADEASAKASVAQAQATLDANRSDLAKALVHSPINGIVLERDIEPGQTVAASFESPILFTLAEDLTQMELQVDVDEADVGQVKEGQDATFTVAAYSDQEFLARTTQVRYGSETTEGVVTYKGILAVDNSSLKLRPGMTATAEITVEKRENALLVPNAALRFAPPQAEESSKSSGSLISAIMPRPPSSETKQRANGNSKEKEQQVWTLRDGQLVPILITKGLSDGVMTEVLSGEIEPGMELVTNQITAAK